MRSDAPSCGWQTMAPRLAPRRDRRAGAKTRHSARAIPEAHSHTPNSSSGGMARIAGSNLVVRLGRSRHDLPKVRCCSSLALSALDGQPTTGVSSLAMIEERSPKVALVDRPDDRPESNSNQSRVMSRLCCRNPRREYHEYISPDMIFVRSTSPPFDVILCSSTTASVFQHYHFLLSFYSTSANRE